MESLKKHLLPGLQAAKANIVPALILQAVAVLIGLAYWFSPPVHALFTQVAEYKERGGYLYSMISTSLWAGILPLVLVRWQKGRKTEPLSRLPFFICYWAFIGLMVDAFYRFQAWLFGDGIAFKTVAAKVCFDMFIFTPIIALPLAITAYAWKDGGFRWAPVRAILRRGFYVERVVPLCLVNWAVWTPAVSVMYALPLSLQLPMQNLVQCLWVLFLMVLTKEAEPESEAHTPARNTVVPQTCNC